MEIKLDAVQGRNATFIVDGVSVTRQISDHITQDTLGEHLEAMAVGLAIEAKEVPVALTLPTGYTKGKVLIAPSVVIDLSK